MNIVKVIIYSLKHRGLTATLGKINTYVVRWVARLPILLTYYKLYWAKLFLKRNKKRTTRILGFKVTHQDIKSLYMEFKDIFKNQIYHFTAPTKTPTVIDGGGFIGLSILYFKYHYPQAAITTFEPSKPIADLLKKNIEQNKLTTVTVVEKGLGGLDGQVAFEQSATDAGKISQSGQASITITKLSNYLSTPIDFLKLNIEGAEVDVIKDLAETNKLNLVKELCIEWHSFSHQKQNLDELLRMLTTAGFKYIINHFDYITNKAVRPPFVVEDKTQYYLLVYAQKI